MLEILQRESNKITIANFYEGFELGKYNFDPPYQRRSLWTEEKKSFLIDSVLKNFPIPPIFLHQKIDDSTGKTTYDVIDGKQRLTAIVEFIKNELPVTDEGGEIFEDNPIAGRFFSEFDREELSKYKSQFWRYVIPIEYIDTGDQNVIDSIFDRLNRNGEPLTGQELRNSSYYGSKLLNLIERFSKNPFWQERLSIVDHARMEELEFLSELAFLVLEGSELHSNQTELDRLFNEFADNDSVDYAELERHLLEVTDYMNSLDLDYSARKIGGVSHLYGLFAFCHFCINMALPIDEIRPKINEFYDLWQAKRYEEPLIKQYKDSMSARTKDKAQRRKRREALTSFYFD